MSALPSVHTMPIETGNYRFYAMHSHRLTTYDKRDCPLTNSRMTCSGEFVANARTKPAASANGGQGVW